MTQKEIKAYIKSRSQRTAKKMVTHNFPPYPQSDKEMFELVKWVAAGLEGAVTGALKKFKILEG
jgi:hypothetical protein